MFPHTPRLIPEEAVFRPALALCLSVPGSIGANVSKMTYKEQLLHPSWQRRRLEILQRAEFKCERCEDGETTLHVHHKHYVKGRMAWEYTDDELTALCAPCHEDEGQQIAFRSDLLARLAGDGPLSVEDFFAHGCGAMAQWLANEDLLARLNQVSNDKPYQFWSGRLGRELGWLLTRDGVKNLAMRLESDQQLADELLAVMAKHGIEVMQFR